MKPKYLVQKSAFGGMLAMACLGLIALAGTTPAQPGASGYHLAKTVKLDGPGGWDYLGIDPESRRLFISHDTHVVVLDADTGDVAGDIANTPGVHGVVIAEEFGRGFTSNGEANNVTVFDLKTLQTFGQAPTGKEPDAIVYDPASHRVFTLNAEGSATAIDAATGKVARTVSLPGRPEFAAADGC
jgi:DNA-binding beta-propeller fold protein YncE